MLITGNFEAHALKLVSPDITLQQRQTLVTEMRDSIEIVHTSEYGNFLKHLFPAFYKLLSEGKTVNISFANVSVEPGEQTVTGPPIQIAAAELWSIARPYLYTLETTLISDGNLDTVNTTFGFRTLEWNSTGGLHVNGSSYALALFLFFFSFMNCSVRPACKAARVLQS